jgi:hypothetical protein
LEATKTKLEIIEKERQLEGLEPSALQGLLAPLAGTRLIQLILLRFVILELFLRFYGAITGFLTFSINGAIYSMQQLEMVPPRILGFDAMFLLTYPVSFLQEIGTWLITFAVGWPLFRDASKTAGIDVRQFFKVRKSK